MTECKKISEQYIELKNKLNRFNDLKQDFRKNRQEAVGVKKEITDLLESLEKFVGAKIKVENMPSPFAEIYTDNGLPVPENETKEIDLEKQLEEDCAAYRDCQLETWADDIEKGKERLKKLIRKNKEQLKKELQEGAIAIFMPGRAVQYADAVETLTKKLKPMWKEKGKDKIVKDGFLEWDHLINELKKIAEQKTADIPEEPYLMMTKPTPKPELTDLTVNAQIAEIVERNKKRKKENKPAEFAIMPLEYAAMQKFFAARAEKLKNKAGKSLFGKLNPLDGSYWIRFVSIPLSVGGSVPSGHWFPGDGYLAFALGNAYAYSYSGVRLAVRLS